MHSSMGAREFGKNGNVNDKNCNSVGLPCVGFCRCCNTTNKPQN